MQSGYCLPGLPLRGHPGSAVTHLLCSPFQLVLAGLGQQGWCGVPCVLPALISPSLPSPGALQSLLQAGGIVPAAAPPAQPAAAEGVHRRALLTGGAAWHLWGFGLSAPQGRDLDSCICQILTVLPTLKLRAEKQDGRQQHFQI